MKEEAEHLRVKYRYRSLIVRGQLRLPLEAAKRLIGPDCAYHLYATFDDEGVKRCVPVDTVADSDISE